MILLLTLLSLCATECRVHRVNYTSECGVVYFDGKWHIPDSCGNDSHYFPCRVVEKCDTVCLSSGVAGSTYRITCHPETTLVDSGVTDEQWGSGAPTSGRITFPNRSLRPDEVLPDGNLTPADLADIREMLREWRERRLKDSINTAQHAIHKVCPKCGDCKPRESMMVACTAMGCSSGCCNACTYTFYCAKTDDEFTVTINECDWIVWDGGGK